MRARAPVEQLRDLLAPLGYTIVAVEVGGALHLKSAVTSVDDRALLINPDRVDAVMFEGLERLHVDPRSRPRAPGFGLRASGTSHGSR